MIAVDSRQEAGEDVVAVRLLELPLRLYERAREHHEELVRELALLTLAPAAHQGGHEGGHEVPQRLLRLVRELTESYSGTTTAADAVRDAALERGDRQVDLSYEVPRSAAQALRRLRAMLDEADEFCRQGEHLLTLAAAPDVARFRRWYFSEFLRQIEQGLAPTPWPRHEENDESRAGERPSRAPVI